MTIGLIGIVNDGFKQRLNEVQRKLVAFSDYPKEMFYREGDCFLRPEQDFRAFKSKCMTDGAAVIWGDSHAAALASDARSMFNSGQYTASACPPVIGFPAPDRPNCAKINEFSMNLLQERKPDYVIMHANWSLYWGVEGFRTALISTLQKLKTEGIRPVIVGAVPQFIPTMPELAIRQNIRFENGAKLKVKLQPIREVNAALSALAVDLGVDYWDPLPTLCTVDNDCLAVIQSLPDDQSVEGLTFMAWDYGHLTKSGSHRISAAFGLYLHEIGLR